MKERLKVANPPAKPLLILDGDCGFCRRWVRSWLEWAGGRIEAIESQAAEVRTQFPEIPAEAFQKSVQFVEVDGTVYSGAEAVFRSLAYAPEKRGLLWMYDHVRGFDAISEGMYRIVASQRMVFSRLTRAFFGSESSTFFLVRSLMLRGLGLIYLAAFLSLWVQLPGLIGQNGILPTEQFVAATREQAGPSQRWFLLPTLAWFDASDGMLHAQCAAGVLFSLGLAAGLAPWLSTLALWCLYLSLTVIGRDFLAFQWDNLLLETGLLAVFLAPAGWTLRHRERASWFVIWLFRWLLFRLMFLSGIVKLTSGDVTWRSLTALSHHFQTQPLPTPLAWFAHQLPGTVLTGITGVMFVIELALPFLILASRRVRLWAFWPFVALQVAIMLTGNYAYFNWLTLLLCLSLLDDAALLRFSPSRIREWLRQRVDAARPGVAEWQWPATILYHARAVVFVPFAGLVLMITSMQLLTGARLVTSWPEPMVGVLKSTQPFRSINSYGLFAVMTQKRPEVVIEGSLDGTTWLPYEFRHKPGDVHRAPSFVAPHQPRLDWQMWFAALGTYQQNPWFVNLCLRLLQNQPETLALLAGNPFPAKAPQFVRASRYEYHFATPSERSKDGSWWTREFKGSYLPEISLQGLREPAAAP